MSATTHDLRRDRYWPRWLKIALPVVVAILAALYFTGRLDYALYPVGLNWHQCDRNGFGATFCGTDLTRYEQRVQGVQQQFRQTMQTVTQMECRADPQLAICP